MNPSENHRIDSLPSQVHLNQAPPHGPTRASDFLEIRDLREELARINVVVSENGLAVSRNDDAIRGSNQGPFATSASDVPLEPRELDTLIRMRDPTTGQFVAFDRETGWWARFPTASRADAAMLTHFYEKLSLKQSRNIQDYAQNRTVISGAIIGRKKE